MHIVDRASSAENFIFAVWLAKEQLSYRLYFETLSLTGVRIEATLRRRLIEPTMRVSKYKSPNIHDVQKNPLPKDVKFGSKAGLIISCMVESRNSLRCGSKATAGTGNGKDGSGIVGNSTCGSGIVGSSTCSSGIMGTCWPLFPINKRLNLLATTDSS
uniref:Uncharacterized protein n=1 Tax=Romanomermis culicivorax TaxID=13658 RepID=A0A915KVR2_ROMCU